MEVRGRGASSQQSRRRRRCWRFGAAQFDEARWSLTVDGHAVGLEAKPLELLHELLLHAGEVLSKDELLDTVWSGVTVVEGSLATAVSKLRRALGDSQGTIIVTVPRIGYQLAAPVEVETLEENAAPRFAFEPGDIVPGRPQWRLVGTLGDSGARDVWRARHVKVAETRVFKFADTPDRLRALKREATLARLLMAALGSNGPFAALLEWNFSTGPFFLESRDGGASLLDWAKARGGLAAVPLDQRLTVARAIARALAAVHGAGVLHRDLKPANILVEERGEAFRLRLVDFGSGRLLDDSALAAYAITPIFPEVPEPFGGPASSTPFYRAPELVAGAAPTAQSDLYSLGLILYQLVAADFTKPLALGWEGDVADPLLRGDIADAAAGDPARRIASAAELASRLDRLGERRAEAAENAATAARLAAMAAAETRRSARRPWVRAAMAATAIGLAGASTASVIAIHQRDEARRQKEIAQASYSFLTDDLLARADPAKSSQADETIAEASRRASPEIDRRFRNAPLIAGRLHEGLAHAFDQRTDLAAAATEYAKASAAFGRAGPDGVQDRAITQLQSARMDALSGDPAKLPGARAAVAAARRTADLDRGAGAVWLAATQGAIALAAEDVPAARADFIRASMLAEALPDAFGPRQRLNFRQRIAFVDLRIGDGVAAERKLRPLVAAFAALDGPEHPDTLNIRLNLIQALLVQKRYAAVIDGATRLLPVMERRFGRDHRRTLQLLAVRQQALGSLERYAEAAVDADRVWRTTAAHEGAKAFQAIAGRADAATTQCRAGLFDEGIANARVALADARAAPGPETALAMALRAALADCLIGDGAPASAAPLLAGIDRKKVSELVGDRNWGANLDLAFAQVALARGDVAEASRRADAARPAFASPSSDRYQARALDRLTRALAAKPPGEKAAGS